jgi:hypothetical protein
MKSKTDTQTFYVLRFFRLRDKSTLYAYDTGRFSHKRQWWYSDKERKAYRFGNRGDARGALRSKSFQEDLLHPRSSYGMMEERAGDVYFFEIIKVVETITKTYVEELAVTDAPAMLALGRSAL